VTQSNLQALVERQEKICSEKHTRLSQLQQQLEHLARQRHSLFGDKDPDASEKQMIEKIDHTDQATTELRNLLGELQQKRAGLSERVEALKLRQQEQILQLQNLHRDFADSLAEASFGNEDEFLKSRMDPQEYSILSETILQMQKQLEESATILKIRKIALEEEQQKELTGATTAELSAALNDHNTHLTELQQSMGALKQQLRDNDILQERHVEKLESLAARRRDYERWAKLHELIGSSDGKKFRNFAQGLTFEIMIHHANESLQKMSDRYLLIRDPAEPLELHVIDNYQAGEIRSTKNLSGGESFIVSLALALGLSGMASHNVQVDSLFLDEGFGTLDEESLQTALDTLAGLHQNGKIIGIISHVSGLQERISTRIKVSRGPGGLSTLSGPGTGRLQ
jgi:exonuclease SbcC